MIVAKYHEILSLSRAVLAKWGEYDTHDILKKVTTRIRPQTLCVVAPMGLH